MHKLVTMLQSITIGEVVDLVIITFLIYFILLGFKKARARLILMGMLAMALVYFIARAFHLYITTMVFQGFFAIFLIIIVVIFQEDFRHLFERIAVWGMMKKRRYSTIHEQCARIIANAAANLARKKVGALIVIKGKDFLDRYIEAGVPLDGLLSQVALEAIFNPNAPSHDGAVVIDTDRIMKFGCHLPLSTNVHEIGRLGTRHAAALGLAERGDALCVVVSEEQGTISVAESDRIRKIDTVEHLNAVLHNFYRKRFPSSRTSFMRDFMKGHWMEKVLAIVLACALWVTVGYRMETVRRDFVVPIEYRNLPTDRIIGEPKPMSVAVALSGLERTFDLLEQKEVKLSLDMSQVPDGENAIILTKDMIKMPTELSVVNIDPDTIYLDVERIVTINAPIYVRIKGTPPPGVKILDIKTDPTEIPVVTSSAVAKEKVIILTNEIDVSGLTETKTLTPRLILPIDVKLVGEKLPEIRVTITVRKNPDTDTEEAREEPPPGS